MSPVNANVFSLLHIDIARNSTDDFNLFHDSKRWSQISGNPFAGPITLGFQLESLLEDKIAAFRHQHDEEQLLNEHGLHFSNYQINFANAVKPGQAIKVDIKDTQFKTAPAPVLSNRVIIKADGNLALMGYKKETAQLFISQTPISPRCVS